MSRRVLLSLVKHVWLGDIMVQRYIETTLEESLK